MADRLGLGRDRPADMEAALQRHQAQRHIAGVGHCRRGPPGEWHLGVHRHEPRLLGDSRRRRFSPNFLASWAARASNPRPPAWPAGALPTELAARGGHAAAPRVRGADSIFSVARLSYAPAPRPASIGAPSPVADDMATTS